MTLPTGNPAAVGATAHVFADSLGDTLRIDGPDGHHLERVRRIRSGELLTVADGIGTWRAYEVVAASSGALDLRADGPTTTQPRTRPPIAVAPALVTRSRFDDAVVALVELGVDTIQPLQSNRCVVRWDGAKALAATERLQRLAREAAMQCRRAWLPEVLRPTTPAALAGRSGLLVADATGLPAERLGEVPASGWCVCSGPEGGFDAADLEAFGAYDRLWLADHVLRAETAAVAAAAVLVTALAVTTGRAQ